jgi:hypothetical protein
MTFIKRNCVFRNCLNLRKQYIFSSFLYYNIQKCVSVCTAIDSAPGSATILRPVSLESVGPEGVQREKRFPEK